MSLWAHLHKVGMLRFMFLTQTSRACPLLLFCSCVYFCLYGPLNCISFHKFSRQLSAFSLCSSGLISALLVLSDTFLFMKVSFSHDVILCGWLGLKQQLTISIISFSLHQGQIITYLYHLPLEHISMSPSSNSRRLNTLTART